MPLLLEAPIHARLLLRGQLPVVLADEARERAAVLRGVEEAGRSPLAHGLARLPSPTEQARLGLRLGIGAEVGLGPEADVLPLELVAEGAEDASSGLLPNVHGDACRVSERVGAKQRLVETHQQERVAVVARAAAQTSGDVQEHRLECAEQQRAPETIA